MRVVLVGAGPGDPELLTLRAVRLLGEADVVLYDRLIDLRVLSFCTKDCLLVPVGKNPFCRTGLQNEINTLLVEYARKFPLVVRLKGGDPSVYGRANEEIEFLARQGIACEIVPGVTAACASAAELGISLTDRDIASSVVFLTGHRKAGTPFQGMNVQGRTCVVYMGVSEAGNIVQAFLDAGNDPDLPAAIVASASYPSAQVFTGSLGNVQRIIDENEIVSPAALVLGEVVRRREEFADLRRSFAPDRFSLKG